MCPLQYSVDSDAAWKTIKNYIESEVIHRMSDFGNCSLIGRWDGTFCSLLALYWSP